MALSRVEPLEKDIELLIRQDLSPEARSEVLADFAMDSLREAQVTNTEALGQRPPHQTFVDGRAGADERSVRPDGTIVYEFDIIMEMFAWIDAQLRRHSPVRSGAYQQSHVFFADGVQANPFAPPPGLETATFVNSMPYARKIEHGHSAQSPNGVYEVVASMAARRFGNLAKVTFTYSAVIGGRSVTQALAASSGQPWWLGGGAARKATGSFEKTLSPTAHNKSNVRFPAIMITVR